MVLATDLGKNMHVSLRQFFEKTDEYGESAKYFGIKTMNMTREILMLTITPQCSTEICTAWSFRTLDALRRLFVTGLVPKKYRQFSFTLIGQCKGKMRII